MSNPKSPEGPRGPRPSEQDGDADRGEPELGADREDEIAYRLRQQELVAEFGVFALEATGIEEVMHHATRVAARGMNVELCKFLEYRPDSGDLLVRSGVGWSAGTVGVARLGADFSSPAGYAFRTLEAVLSNHLDEEDRFRTPALLQEHGVRRALNVPVRYETDPYGVLEVDSGHVGKFTSADFAFMESIANTLSVAIKRHAREAELAELREREALLAHEMRHRVKNVLTLVTALVSMARREAVRDVGEFADLLSGRITALATATDEGLAARWSRTEDAGVDPVAVTRRVLAPYGDRIAVTGQAGAMPTADATALALVLHELATNAVKYGALSVPGGRVDATWTDADDRAHLVWTERGGPAPGDGVDPSGFGHGMINRMLMSIGGTIDRDWSDDGLVVRVALS